MGDCAEMLLDGTLNWDGSYDGGFKSRYTPGKTRYKSSGTIRNTWNSIFQVMETNKVPKQEVNTIVNRFLRDRHGRSIAQCRFRNRVNCVRDNWKEFKKYVNCKEYAIDSNISIDDSMGSTNLHCKK